MPVFMNNGTGQKGFTLLELIIVLLLIGIIAGLVGISIANSVPSNRFRSDVRTLASLMRYASKRAVYTGLEKTLEIDLDEKTVTYEGKVRIRFPEGTGISIKTPDGGEIEMEKYRFVFYPEGGTEGETVIIKRGGKGFTLELDPLLGAVLTKGGAE
ncbi:MAG: prepilin-type N-terminal cleavage/methylation domain-containing protein [Nitrospirae bacterium]|nr:MAG: prepilin-type N-terminal cleavage/methylation domain-containing protein [Nitrospirota bacterium]